MKYHPILFSTAMVQGIDENRKTQTRRTKGLEKVNENPDEWEFWRFFDGHAKFVEKGNASNEKFVKCPYNLGDVLWVRETFCGIIQKDESTKYHYKANANWALLEALKIIWKPSLFMPKIACRTFLKIKSIRVERIWQISEEDAIAEGIEKIGKTSLGIPIYKEYFLKSETPCFCAANSFRSLWKKINGEESWYQNPFVWVYEFEKIEKPEDFI